ncbi:metallophosphoesterase family protein [Cellulosilyticum sp. I15G10I2]|uniref:metallophosphoesterase family protein n=1 Tax=Cellulosilyticum sp. I15G10I2 TaxID=1892843 RepID=UPI00085C7521|nr:metallophosphoesterase family protein [Cellulosilyticum sp. I15G10I2]
MKRIAIISDIHGNIEALNAVLKHIKDQKCDQIFCTGDLVGYGPRPNEVIETIRSLRIPTIMGNYDEAVGFLLPACGCYNSDANAKKYAANSLKWSITHTTQKNREFLRGLPEQLEIEVGDKKMLLIHATSDSISEYVYENDTERLMDLLDYVSQDIYVYGHTHFPYSVTLPGRNKTIINAGSVGRPKNGDARATYIVLGVEDGSVSGVIHKVSYDVAKVIKEIEESGLDNYFAEFLKNGGAHVKDCKCSGEDTTYSISPKCT